MTPKNCYSVFHYSRIGAGKKLLDFFFFLKILHGRYFNIFHQTTVVYLYYNCHQDPYRPSIQRGADVFSSFHSLFFYEDVTCIVKDGSSVFAET